MFGKLDLDALACVLSMLALVLACCGLWRTMKSLIRWTAKEWHDAARPEDD